MVNAEQCLTVRKALKEERTATLIIIEGHLKVFQQFSSSKLVLKTIESCFVALNYYENVSIMHVEASGAWI